MRKTSIIFLLLFNGVWGQHYQIDFPPSEFKKRWEGVFSQIGENSSVAHLSYIGDTTIGKKVNIGAGTITCNYDGKNKNKTFIDDNSFIGSNSSLIAPIKIGKNVTIAAGSVIDKNVKSNNLAIERSKLLILSKKRRSKNS